MPNKPIRIAVISSEFNADISDNLMKCCLDELRRNGLTSKNIYTTWVPGAYELPLAAQKLARSKKFDAVICLGCVIKGETAHDTFVSLWSTLGIGWVSMTTNVPVLFGVLTPKNLAQAKKRSRPGPLNRGKEVAEAAVKMAKFMREKI